MPLNSKRHPDPSVSLALQLTFASQPPRANGSANPLLHAGWSHLCNLKMHGCSHGYASALVSTAQNVLLSLCIFTVPLQHPAQAPGLPPSLPQRLQQMLQSPVS